MVRLPRPSAPPPGHYVGRKQRQGLAVELANRENRSSWKDFLLRSKERGLSGDESVVSGDHAGLAIFSVLTAAACNAAMCLP